jgi:predicted nucleotidyltransferase
MSRYRLPVMFETVFRALNAHGVRYPANPMLVVDLFAERPADFEGLWARAKDVPLETTSVKIVAVDDLIAMKRQAGRPKDLLDIAELERLRELKDGAP